MAFLTSLVILAAIVISVIAIYNSLIRLRLQSENAWADVDVQLKRRYDLIPILVETVKAYAGHEKGTLERVVTARNQAINAQGAANKSQAEGMLGQALKSLFALAEAYPELRAVESFSELTEALRGVEETIQNARRYYNAVVRDLNTKIAMFPSNLVASFFNFAPHDFFEIEDAEERAVPSVNFSN
jgi:LemA protein